MLGFRLTVMCAGSLLIASAQVIGDVREAIALHDFATGEKYIQNYRAKNGITIRQTMNRLTLEGERAPPLEMTVWLCTRPVPLDQLKGRPVLLFFWAHWSGDCKREVPDLARLVSQYASKGLVGIGPTQHYG